MAGWLPLAQPPLVDPATTAWVNAVNTLAGSSVVGNTNKGIVDTLIKALKADPSGNLFTSNDRLWLLALAGESTFEAQVDILNLVSWTSHGGFTLDSNGFAGNGSTGYLDTGFIPSTAGGNFTNTSASLSIAVFNPRTTTANVVHMGTNDAGLHPTTAALNSFSNQIIIGIGGPQASFVGTATSKGFGLGSAIPSTVDAYINGTQVNVTSQVPAALSRDAIFISADNNSGSPILLSTDQIVAAHIGGGMTATQALNFTTTVNNALASLGKNVF